VSSSTSEGLSSFFGQVEKLSVNDTFFFKASAIDGTKDDVVKDFDA
jgi:hypothetical protein